MAQTQPNLFSRLVGLFRSTISAPAPGSATVAEQLERLNALFESNMDRLIEGLVNGTVSLGQFDGAMRSAIKQHHLAAALIGHGGEANASPQTLALAQRQVDSQLAYFDAWMRDLYAAKELPSQAYMANRAKLYGKAAKATATEARIEAKGLPPLPFQPADGKTQCRVNCKCQWVIKTLSVANDNYDCYYTLGAAEHCPTCLARSRVANPLRVRNGVIMDAEKYQAAELYA